MKPPERPEPGPFAEPWQAEAFALVIGLHDRGAFTWSEWAAALSAEIAAAESDDDGRYYEHWLAALERLVTARGLTEPEALATRKAAWSRAYRDTPHGRPVSLA